VIVPTQKVKDLLLTYSVHKQISIVPTGVDLKKFNPALYSKEDVRALKKQYNIQEQDKIMLYLGRVSKEKNIGEIIESMPEYMSKREHVKFVIVGNGPEMETLNQMVAERNLEDRILFTGAQPWDNIGLFYQMGDVFVSGSTSETQGLTYIEAMAAGLPVVARQDRCLDDILIPGWNGYDFTERRGLLEGLDAVLFGTDGTAYGENARKNVQKLSTEAFARNVIKVYEEVMKRDAISKKREEYESRKIRRVFRR
jgi:1,2-diacylglycerol 3-alpha-glucosyltransferase